MIGDFEETLGDEFKQKYHDLEDNAYLDDDEDDFELDLDDFDLDEIIDDAFDEDDDFD
ncbi:hypothetical protein Q4534_04215 [Cyclobacterium sp. 1_MG-2023]|uniref:hypothetical protein n=1 Tax=Cyclobacterium sp. 1_MG-2023 TaxID=3062681 RepID=UPI0026E36F2E|nr:hypothetical protein [Cyclobacterium sp. 1_MG-2023]MDO6436594.1 hypothetical protein [Cyclobacterium sp. 1_MG-2023]